MKNRVAQVIGMSIAALALPLLSLMGTTGALAASATEPMAIDAIDASSVTVTTTNGSTALTQGNTVKVTAAWSVPATATAGDIFTLQLPAELAGTASSFDLPSTEDPTQPVAHCALTGGTGATLTCTLTDYVDNHLDVSGTLWLHATAKTVTSEENLEFVVAGETVYVSVPGGIQTPGTTPTNPPVTPLPTKPSKSVWQNGSSSLGWQIVIPGAQISTLDEVTVTDELTPASATVQEHRNIDGRLTVQYRTADSNSWLTYTAWSGAWNETGTGFSLVLAGPFEDTKAYRVSYTTVPTQAFAGDVFANAAVINGVTLTAQRAWAYTGGGTGTGVNLTQFAVTKQVDSASTIDSATASSMASLDYTVRYTVEGDPTVRTLTVKSDGSETYSLRLPAGRTITLEEIDIPAVDGYTWKTPVFSGDAVIDTGDGTATIMNSDAGSVAHLTLTNTLVPTPVSTPEPEPTTPAEPTPTNTAVAPGTPTSTSSAAPATPGQQASTASLAITGGDNSLVGTSITIGILALIVGAGLIARSRRATRTDA